MTSQEILEKYLSYFKQKDHKQVPNVSLVPENDPTLLYVNSGMFPLVPYLSGEPHPLGKRLVNVQRCLRFNEDLENVGETNRHTTAFHMMGNWSLGDYFKKEQLPWIYEYLIDELGLDPKRMYGTVFVGDDDAPKDEAAIKILKEVFAKYGIEAKEGERIFAYGKEDNWWQRGDAIGELGGPDSEIFYYLGEDDGFGKDPADHQDEFLEIGNSVFMQYEKTEDGWGELPQKNVDFGGGLERLALVSQEKTDIYETDSFYPIIQKLEELSDKQYLTSHETTKAMRMIADHMRSASLLAMDGVMPSNKDQGYILRRLLRRMVRAARNLGLEKDISVSLVPVVTDMLAWLYPELKERQDGIMHTFGAEEEKFRKTLNRGAKEFAKQKDNVVKHVNDNYLDALAQVAFDLYQSLGYPFEMFVEDLREAVGGLEAEFEADLDETFGKMFLEHQKSSRAGAEKKFKGGLADHSEQTIRYHTATHLIHHALREVLGEEVVQHGSNITGERLRFDFNYPTKLSADQIKEIEALVDRIVHDALPVKFEILPKEKALATGAIHAFNEKYGDEVKVYYIGGDLESAVSKEFCGGPHVENTREIGEIQIYKQDKIGEGMLRIYAK